MPQPTAELFVSAGEISGDLHGARLLQALRRRHPGLRAFGIGGPRLEAAGLEKTADIEELSLVGIIEVLPRLRSLLRLQSETRKLLARRRPTAVLLIDSPDFNLRLARHARSLGLKVIYYIGPTVWAWRKGRLDAIRDTVDLMLTVLPFEEELYHRHGVRSLYVGHPLVEMVTASTETFSPADFLSDLGVPDGSTVVSLLPGSRRNEIKRLLPVIVEAAQILSRTLSSLHFLVPAASREIFDSIQDPVKESLPNSSVTLGRAGDCLASSRAAVVTSGTATLEAALRGTPFVTVYRLSPLSYLVGKLLVKTRYISLPNILCGREVVRELIQSQCRPDTVAEAAGEILRDRRTAVRMIRSFDSMKKQLGPGSAAEKAAAAVAGEAGLDAFPGAGGPHSPGEDQ
jgi:lipid-A-disaccharide synthase